MHFTSQPLTDSSSSSSEEHNAQIALVCSFVLNLIQIQLDFGSGRVDRVPRHLREGVSFESVTGWMPEEMFVRAFRMTRTSFVKLYDLVKFEIQRDAEMGRRSGYYSLSPDVRLGICLRLLAGASYIDLCIAFRVGVSTIYEVFRTTCEALQLKLRLPGLPNSFNGLHRLSTEFKISRTSASPLSGCIGALDGIVVKVKKPKRNQMPAAYFNRKGYYALPIQALVDADYRFLCYSCLCVGSTHDSTAHAVSSLGRYLAQGRLQDEFWICADEAYNCTEHLITPFPFSQAGEDEINFNYFLSSFRVHVEQAFGQLVARWRIMRDEIGFDVSTCARIACLCLKLHNFCIDEREREFGENLNREERENVDAELRSWYNDVKEDLREMGSEEEEDIRSSTVSRKRDLMVNYIRRCGIRRPTLYGVPYLE